MTVPWLDKHGVTHACDMKHVPGQWARDNHHAGWYTMRAPCGASRRLRHGQDRINRPRGADIDCMACIAKESENA